MVAGRLKYPLLVTLLIQSVQGVALNGTGHRITKRITAVTEAEDGDDRT